ncbi:hypothetical protein H8A95_42215 [Bradyrhizobium sp. Pear76]|uniref:hypothetical protein n=1 Tax=Bradyrhizobium oropedii TaxID=1571201 RepID=UPI001E5CACB8|nr:hypothetical protein [Bradyrhizobium oropedii]MCC8968721.1 hypothetical protein [Bradyrhizobium oropedii]
MFTSDIAEASWKGCVATASNSVFIVFHFIALTLAMASRLKPGKASAIEDVYEFKLSPVINPLFRGILEARFG